ncbi:hypothetical protein Ahy_A05g023987 [Arachis hypogaea]|uniref:SWIM-type domain-containing protein n=1 Tax=Arachis hypogaea TaxID=3818 RepID=A0A445D528_ARAHY|nr:hypothetical protein Ahy_A05g023987 [Arachis hypogaea]
MLKQHRELSMSVRHTIENNEEASIRPSKAYESFIAAARGYRKLNFIEKDKIPSKLNGYKGHTEIEQEMSQVVWYSHTKDSFDRNWNDFLLKYGLVENKWLSVTYDSVATQVKCQCLLFESGGILCHHALSVLSVERVIQVSPRYILERWSKKVKRRHTHIKSSHDEPLLEPRSKRFDKLMFRSQNICEFASESEELTAILHRAYDSVMVEME